MIRVDLYECLLKPPPEAPVYSATFGGVAHPVCQLRARRRRLVELFSGRNETTGGKLPRGSSDPGGLGPSSSEISRAIVRDARALAAARARRFESRRHGHGRARDVRR